MAEIFEMEMNKVIMGNLGIASPNHFGSFGIVHNDFLYKESIDVQYDDSTTQKHTVYSATTKESNALSTSCCLMDSSVYLVMLFAGKSLYGLRFDFDALPGEHWGDFLFKSNNWVVSSRFERIMVLAEVEKISTSLLTWEKSESKEMFENLKDFIDHCI